MSTYEFLLDIYLDDLGYINRNSCIADLVQKHCNPLENIQQILNIISSENPLL